MVGTMSGKSEQMVGAMCGQSVHMTGAMSGIIGRANEKRLGKREKRHRMRLTEVFLAGILALGVLLSGCNYEESAKVRDLDAVIVSEEALPKELKEIIDGKKEEAFQLTYTDRDYLYICIGYGKQETGGYSIALNDLYLTETEVVVDTTLLGPEASDQAKKTATYPFIVIRTETSEQPVVFR